MKHYQSESKAIEKAQQANRADNRNPFGRMSAPAVVVDGPDNMFSVMNLAEAINAGFLYRIFY